MSDARTTWDPFQSPPAPASPLDEARQHQLADLARATFATPAGRAFLDALHADLTTQPSYLPGMAFDQVAYLEGQKALLRRIQTLRDQKET
jgi:hypothetical protein